MTDFAALLPKLLPRAIEWAQAQSHIICGLRGKPLSERELALAKAVGVTLPEWIRIWTVTSIPPPEDPELARFAHRENLIGPDTKGLTLGYGIFIRKGHDTPRLLSHEFRHVYQVEQAGSLADFLPVYLKQIADYTYAKAPYEVDACAHEHSGYPDD